MEAFSILWARRIQFIPNWLRETPDPPDVKSGCTEPTGR